MRATVAVFGTLFVTTFGFNNVATTVNLLTKVIMVGLTGAFQLRLTEMISTAQFHVH